MKKGKETTVGLEKSKDLTTEFRAEAHSEKTCGTTRYPL